MIFSAALIFHIHRQRGSYMEAMGVDAPRTGYSVHNDHWRFQSNTIKIVTVAGAQKPWWPQGAQLFSGPHGQREGHRRSWPP